MPGLQRTDFAGVRMKFASLESSHFSHFIRSTSGLYQTLQYTAIRQYYNFDDFVLDDVT